MGRMGVLAAILLISFVSTLSDASAGLRLRDLLADAAVKDKKPDSQKDSPTPPPGIQPKGGDLKQDEKPSPPSDPKKPTDPPPPPPQAGKPNPVNPAVPPPPPAGSGTIPKVSSSPPPPKGSSSPPPQSPSLEPHKQTNLSPPPPPASVEQDNKANPGSDGKDHGKNNGDKEGSVDKFREDVCKESGGKCSVADLVGCLHHPGTDLKGSSILVQNTGTSTLTVQIVVPSSIKIDTNRLVLNKHQNKEINFSTNVSGSLKIILKTEKGSCTLQTTSFFFDWNIEKFPAYATNAAQIYGVYILIFSILIAGGTWACCKFVRKGRRTDAGVPYQQLEMGTQTQTSSAEMHGSTADGWEQGWDDDWDDEEAVVRSSDKHPTGNASANGLTSRSTNKDGWEDWDD